MTRSRDSTSRQPGRDHGGNLDAAIRRHGGVRAEWLDLSTGINPCPYPLPQVPDDAWRALPQRGDIDRLNRAAAQTYGSRAAVAAFAGAQGAIQALPWLTKPGKAQILTPTYNEYAGALGAAHWEIEDVSTLNELTGSDIAIVVNPNNPDGKRYTVNALAAVSGRVGLLVVDESFADPEPGLSMAPRAGNTLHNVIVLRSFGKFYGLAGIRLGFAIGSTPVIERLAGCAGPWPVSGPAIEIASRALRDIAWQEATIARLERDAARLDALAAGAGWRLVGGCALFRTYWVANAAGAQNALAMHRIWSRIFPYSAHWVRLGLAAGERQWERLARAFSAFAEH